MNRTKRIALAATLAGALFLVGVTAAFAGTFFWQHNQVCYGGWPYQRCYEQDCLYSRNGSFVNGTYQSTLHYCTGWYPVEANV